MRSTIALCLAALPLGAFAQAPDDILTGDVRLACEAILCLSSGQAPSECQPSLKRYFSIVRRTTSRTLQARRDFLKLCPTANENDYMRNLVESLVDGSGRCDAAALNGGGWSGGEGNYSVSNKMPANCVAYYANTGVDLQAPKYVGTPERGGHWVEASAYDAELAAYNERIRKEDEARANASSGS